MEPNLNNTSPVVQPEQNQPVQPTVQPMQPVQPVQPAQDDGKKKKGILIIFIILGLCLIGALVAIFVPWSKIFGDTSTNKEDESSVAKDSNDDVCKDLAIADGVDGVLRYENNSFKIFEGHDCVAELTMGTNINGVQTPLLKIKIPPEYHTLLPYTDNDGKKREMVGKYKEIAKKEEYNSADKLPGYVLTGDAMNDWIFNIVSVEDEYGNNNTVEGQKEYRSDGIILHEGSDHEAYVYGNTSDSDDNSGFDVVGTYEINEDYVLLFFHKADKVSEEEIFDKFSLEEIGEEFYNLVTVLE